MRNIGIVIVLALWILIGWKMCTDYPRCCPGANVAHEEAVTPVPSVVDKCSQGIICFEDNSCDPSYGSSFTKFRDSLISLVTENKRLRITGIFNTSESYDGTADNLGACRADNVRKAFAGLRDDQVRTGGQITVGRDVSNTERITFDVLDMASISGEGSGGQGAKVSSPENTAGRADEVAAQAIIYFPFNSTNKLNDTEIESYLNKVAANIKGTGQKVRLTGHTDDIGNPAANIVLGQRRANIIADYLIGQGVLRSQIISESKGETQPVASNSTELGRARNRRTELQLIK